MVGTCGPYDSGGSVVGYLPKVLALGQKLILRKPFLASYVGDVVSPPTSTFMGLYVKLMPRHHEICKIYDRQKHLQQPF
jgi:hypothetical protein